MEDLEHKKEIEQFLKDAELSALSKDAQDKILELLPRVASIFVEKQSFFSSPLPSAEILEAYNRIIPNAADRIMCMVEKQSDHRRQIEKDMLTVHSEQTGKGQTYAFILAIILILVGTASILLGQVAVASTIFSTTVIGLVTVFAIGRKS